MNKLLLKIFMTLSLLCGMTLALSAQGTVSEPKKNEVTIGNTKISREGKELVIDYDIRLGKNVQSCVVDVVMNVDGRVVNDMSLSDLSGDFGKIKTSGKKQVRFNVDNMKHNLAGMDIRFTLNVANKDILDDKVVAMASASVFPQLSYGLMLGYVKKFGGYVKYRSDFVSVAPSYSCTSTGNINGGGLFWASGNQKKSRMQATGGFMLRVSQSMYPYVGAGYGSRGVYWEDHNNKWAEVSDYSCKGVAAEAGMIFKFGPLAVSAGVSTTAFKYIEAEVGIGMMF